MAEAAAHVGVPARSRRVQAVDHAIDVLVMLGETGGSVSIGRIAQKIGLSKASVYHLLTTLESRQFVVRDAESARYRLGWSLYELGSKVAYAADVGRVARYYLDRLAVETGESVLLGILDHDAVLYLDRGDAPRGFHMVAGAGRRSPLHATASGKALLALSGDSGLVSRILAGPLQRFTEATITDPDRLLDELNTIRQRKYATCWQEHEVGLCSIAVPVRDYTGSVVATLAVAGPAPRLNANRTGCLSSLREAARSVEARLGHGAGGSSRLE